jgi:hypothetical protein
MSQRRLYILASPWFGFSLLVLLLNDLVFKQQFHNELTGKLSDVVGLFLFPLFWVAFFPRLKSPIYLFTGVLFILWKSVYSQVFIDGWNNLGILTLERTVDYGDLIALLVLPFSYVVEITIRDLRTARPMLYLIALVAIFAFTATSYSHKTDFNDEYEFSLSRAELLERIKRLPTNGISRPLGDGEMFQVTFDSCNERADITIRERENKSFITLKQIDYRCPSKGDKEEMRRYFEKEFIAKLREEPVTKSPRVLYIWPVGPVATPSPSGSEEHGSGNSSRPGNKQPRGKRQ